MANVLPRGMEKDGLMKAPLRQTNVMTREQWLLRVRLNAAEEYAGMKKPDGWRTEAFIDAVEKAKEWGYLWEPIVDENLPDPCRMAGPDEEYFS